MHINFYFYFNGRKRSAFSKLKKKQNISNDDTSGIIKLYTLKIKCFETKIRHSPRDIFMQLSIQGLYIISIRGRRIEAGVPGCMFMRIFVTIVLF